MKALKYLAFLKVAAGLLLIYLSVQSKQEVAIRFTASYNPLSHSSLKKKTQKTNKLHNKTQILMNDPDINKNWGLKVSSALKAHGITKGSRSIKVAVIDTGIDVNHKDLKNNLWQNPGETGKDSKGRNKATNGIDDDKNGFVDDIHGWNFVQNNHKLTDNHGHGTHIAGIVGAEGGNKFGITGIASEVSLIVLKYYDPKVPGDNLKNTIKAIDYAVAAGADIINYSGGGTEYSQQEFEAIRRARSKGVLFVAAAGNEQSNSDKKKYYPANYKLDNVISVTAINPQLKVLPSSNYGIQTVDVAAPGSDIYSTLPGNVFGTLTGTSQATAFASGLAALIKANHEDFTYHDLKKHILSTGDEYPWLRSKTGTSKKLNMYKALTTLDRGISASGTIAHNDLAIKQSTFSNETTSLGPQPSGFSLLKQRLQETYGPKANARTINNK